MADSSEGSPVQPTKKAGLSMGKVIAVLVIVVILIAGGYSFSKHTTKSQTATSGSMESQAPEASPTERAPHTSRQVSAGKKADTFTNYTVTVPGGWLETHMTTPADILIISKGDYSVTITQAAGGGGNCTYPKDPQDPMSQHFKSFVDITGTASKFRRGPIDSTKYTICEQKGKGYVFPTVFGYISYKVPATQDAQTVAKMDSIVTSLKK